MFDIPMDNYNVVPLESFVWIKDENYMFAWIKTLELVTNNQFNSRHLINDSNIVVHSKQTNNIVIFKPDSVIVKTSGLNEYEYVPIDDLIRKFMPEENKETDDYIIKDWICTPKNWLQMVFLPKPLLKMRIYTKI